MEDCKTCNTEHTYRLKKLDSKVEELDKCSQEIKIKVEKVDESVKSAHSRLNEIGEQTLAIYKLSVAVENIAEQLIEFTQENKEHRKEVNNRLDKQDDKLEKQNDEIKTLKNAPAKEAYDMQKEIKKYIVIAVVGVVLGAIFAKLGVKP